MTLDERFWAKVQKAGLLDHWTWTGAFSEKRHYPPRPVFWLGRAGARNRHIVVPAFRVALSLTDGVPLWERVDLHACHTVECSQPWCMNPAHGYWGTREENTDDRYPLRFRRVRSAAEIRAGLGHL